MQHFPSLDHAVLRAKLARAVSDGDVLWLIDRILASGEGVLADEYRPVYFPGDDLLAVCRPRGLPIGQGDRAMWKNPFLDPLSLWERVRVSNCVRGQAF